MSVSAGSWQRILVAVLTLLLALSVRYFFLDYGPDKGLLLGYNQSKLSSEQQLNIQLDHLDRYRQPYLISPDSYFYLAEVAQYLKTPAAEANPLVIAYAELVQFLRPILRKPTKHILYYTPIIFFVLILGAFFLFASANAPILFASLATLLLSVSPSLVLNTQAGLIDHNALYLLTFVLVMGLSLSRIRANINYWSFITASAALVWFASTFWGSWVLLTLPIAVVSVIDLLRKLETKEIKNRLFLIVLFVAVLAALGLLAGVDNIYLHTTLQRLGVISDDIPTRFTMTRELQGLSLIQLFQIEALAWLSAAGLIYIALKIRNPDKHHYASGILTLTYLLLALVFQRLAVFFVIASGFFLVALLRGITDTTFKKAIVIFITIAAGTHSVLVSRMTIASATRMDDQTYNRFELVGKLTPDNALIVSWWDYGYYFSAISERQAFTYPGKFSNTGRLSLIARLLYADSNSALRKIKEIECRRRRIEGGPCDFPVYIYIDDQFENFHRVIPQFLPKNEPHRSTLIDNPFIQALYPCAKEQSSFFCGDYEIEYKQESPTLVSASKNIHSFISETDLTTKNELIDQSGSYNLVLKKTDSGFSLLKIHKNIESTPLFRLMIYDHNDHPNLEIVYRDEQNGRMVLLKDME